ncbi:hypothetical protein P7C73_g559, partial [Tremellales sp. Uapishka_1]
MSTSNAADLTGDGTPAGSPPDLLAWTAANPDKSFWDMPGIHDVIKSMESGHKDDANFELELTFAVGSIEVGVRGLLLENGKTDLEAVARLDSKVTALLHRVRDNLSSPPYTTRLHQLHFEARHYEWLMMIHYLRARGAAITHDPHTVIEHAQKVKDYFGPYVACGGDQEYMEIFRRAAVRQARNAEKYIARQAAWQRLCKMVGSDSENSDGAEDVTEYDDMATDNEETGGSPSCGRIEVDTDEVVHPESTPSLLPARLPSLSPLSTLAGSSLDEVQFESAGDA